MELLSNLVWIAVTLALWSVWLFGRRSGRGAWLRPGVAVQVASLAVLTLILLPVISVSDDLQASHNPAEVERTSVRNDQHWLRPDAVRPTPAALLAVIGWFLLAPARTIALLRSPAFPRCERIAHLRPPASRAPPTF